MYGMYSEDHTLDLGGLEPPLNRRHWGSRFLYARAGWWLTDGAVIGALKTDVP